ncbi:DUF4097 family beta strand repeat-containing protein [Halanaerobium sp. ST460_2HS_T2]|uniref:DUF4097 family beta strand repeat-containing protein n=1 Tax=Halanaerobium sp. ST460_2HS_T2 TaxID=2183914 RepID=UPI000DF3568D|nr:DUF4097 family beta strand repeat-containing protein [Halanaerobium sp. ST460_2HS_T2]RCW52557.1 putative adhesin [Halanaerobium sp. ST460_2HS_T2]
MSRKKFVTYLLIILTLVMIADIRYVRSDNHLFQGFITESIEDLIKTEGTFFQNSFDSDSIKAEKDGSLVLDYNFLNENKEVRTFYLKNDFGSIDLTGTQNQEINIDYTLKVHAEDKEAAEEFIKDLEVIYNLRGDKLEIALNKSQTSTPDLINVVEIDYRISIPENLMTDLRNKYGALDVSSLDAALEASNRYGSTNIDNISGRVEVDLDYGEARITNLASSLNLESAYTENTVRNIEGEFKLESAYGFNRIQNLASDLIINSRYGGAEISEAKNIDINSRYTGFSFENISGKITADIEYGDLRLKNISDLDFELQYADCTIERLKDYELYNYDLKVEYGNIAADLGGVNYENKKELVYRGSRAEHNISISSEYGDILIK